MLTSTLMWLSLSALPGTPQGPSIDSVAVRKWREGQVAIAAKHAESRSKDSTELETRLRVVHTAESAIRETSDDRRRSEAWADVAGRDVLDSVRRGGDAGAILITLLERRRVAQQSLIEARVEVGKLAAATKSWADQLSSAQRQEHEAAKAEADCRQNARVGLRQAEVFTACRSPSTGERQAMRESIFRAAQSRSAAEKARNYARGRADALEAEVSELDQFIVAGRKALGK